MRFPARMNVLVELEMTLSRETLPTEGAEARLLSGVNALV